MWSCQIPEVAKAVRPKRDLNRRYAGELVEAQQSLSSTMSTQFTAGLLSPGYRGALVASPTVKSIQAGERAPRLPDLLPATQGGRGAHLFHTITSADWTRQLRMARSTPNQVAAAVRRRIEQIKAAKHKS